MSSITDLQRRVTINDVARSAGVSVGTVSAVINSRASVAERTRRRVLDVIDKLGYEPASSAQALASGRKNGDVGKRSIGIISKEASNPFYVEVIHGAQSYLSDRGYLLYSAASEWNYEHEGFLLESFRSRMFSGAIVAPVINEEADLSHLFMLRRMNFPFVLLDNVTGLQANTVFIDSVKASRIAVDYLQSIGHQHIIHFSGPGFTVNHGRDRIAGFRQAFESSSARFEDRFIVEAGSTLEDGYATGLRYFGAIDRTEMPTAVTCFNDRVAIGLLKALHELGLRVPEDISVVGYDDIDIAAFASVPLTTIRNPKQELGRRAAELLVGHLESAGRPPVEKVALDVELIVRNSTQALET
jgi:LacI family transcriptional regulator